MIIIHAEMVHANEPSTEDTDAGRPLSSITAWSRVSARIARATQRNSV